MKLGMIGLGRMGSNMVLRLLRAGQSCAVYDLNPDAVQKLATEGATPAYTLAELVEALPAPRAIWIMVPAGLVDQSIDSLLPSLSAGDILIDGGNSHYQDDIRRARELRERGLHYIDVGTSGGVWGLERGYCQMIGGEREPVERLDSIFAALAPGGTGSAPERGYVHCGPAGAGHFVKMVHNGIEYGLMAAYAEGMNILRHAGAGKHAREDDAETTPLRNPEHYAYDLPLPGIAEAWRHGSVISSWLLDLLANALRDDVELSGYAGRVSDSGEGRWTLNTAIDVGVPAPVLYTALSSRFSSRDGDDYANKLLSALRHQFGGHVEKKP